MKFQLFRTEKLLSRNLQSDVYPIFKNHQLPRKDYQKLCQLAEELEVEIAASVFDLETLAWYLNETSPPFIKIASGDITFKRLLQAAGTSQKPVVLSTAAAKKEEIRRAIDWLGEKKDLHLLHCTPSYPTAEKNINLQRMLHLREEFKLPVGFSDHSTGEEPPLRAAAAGARIWERHVTLDQEMDGPEHSFSMPVERLEKTIDRLKSSPKQPPAVEGPGLPGTNLDENYRQNARRSLFAGQKIRSGEKLSEDNLRELRPDLGISAAEIDQMDGRTATRSFNRGELIQL